MRTMRALMFLLLLASLAVAGCNTTEGFGKDMQAGGRKIENAAAK